MKTLKTKLQELEIGQLFIFNKAATVYKMLRSEKTFSSNGSLFKTYYIAQNTQSGQEETFSMNRQFMWVTPVDNL